MKLKILDVSENFKFDDDFCIPINSNAKYSLSQTVIIAFPKIKDGSKKKVIEEDCEIKNEGMLFKNENDQNYFGNFDPNPLHILKPFQIQS